MAKSPNKNQPKDEPGAEDRFLSGVRRALEMPHKPHKAQAATQKKKAQKSK